MSEFRLRAARPGSGIRRTFTEVRLAGVDARPVDIVLEDGIIAELRPSGSRPADGATTDAAGRWVLPGLWDSHVHFTQWAQTSRRFDLSGTRTAAEALAVVDATTASGASADESAVGFGFRDALWPDTADLAAFDRVSHGQPVILIAGDLHCVWLNTAALRRYGHDGHETGLLREEDAFAVHRSIDAAPDAVVDGWVRDAAEAAAARGVVGVVDFEMAWNLDSWTRRIAAGILSLRTRFGIYPHDLDRAIAERLRTGQVLPHTHGLLEVGSLKVITDGSLNTRTAYCVDPYPGLGGTEHSHGVLTVPPDELTALMSRARQAGLESAIHAIGDQANTHVLDAFAATGSRGSVEHAQLLSADDIGRFAALGVTASVQPEHAMDDRDVAEHYWAGRTDRAFPLRSILDAGGTLALGSDAPVAPLDPWLAISAAVGRSRDNRAPWHPEQSISVAEAIAASTRGATLRAGQVADLVLVDRDPFAASPDDLRRMPVAATVLNGRDTFSTL
ncbi:amidohydrolase family protein [Mycetocola sp. 2940]|uniref:amidohydrolase n=1 Tax=Mycetocola sp. 2940 TaxID=3156452 RepID=UPI003397E30B